MSNNVTPIGENKEALDKSKLSVITERIDDVGLLIGQMAHMNLPEILDRHIRRHWNQRALSWGWTAVIWLAYILTQGDHRKISMEKYVSRMQNSLSIFTKQPVSPLDFSDDRLAHLLRHLSKRDSWNKIEEELNEHSIEVYELELETVRCDATTISSNQKVREGGLVQFGHSKDDPSSPQVKLMVGSLDDLGMPLASDVVSGETADDILYIPLIDRINKGLQKSNLLFVGDCKMSAVETRAHIVSTGHHYLSPLPLTGNTAHEIEDWISIGLAKEREKSLISVFRKDYRGKEYLAGQGYEFKRFQELEKDGVKTTWEERVQVIKSPAHARKQSKGLDKRVINAQKKIKALTPPRGRGKRQITKEDELLDSIDKIVKSHRVKELLNIKYEKQVERKTKYIGRGRGSVNRKTKVEEKVRYQITSIELDSKKVTKLKDSFGWKAFVTSSPVEKLSLHDAVLSYRNEYRVERIFNRLKSRLNIAPLFVKKDDQIEGLTYLLTLGVRVLTLMEFVVKRSLQEDNTELTGMHPENLKKSTDKPSAERILKTFSGIDLTIIRDLTGNVILRYLTPLSTIQKEIIQRLKLDTSLYLQLE